MPVLKGKFEGLFGVAIYSMMGEVRLIVGAFEEGVVGKVVCLIQN